jgi:23S rRNA pseudouridine1911/1915/1917 synthase
MPAPSSSAEIRTPDIQKTLTVPIECAGQRLDQALSDLLAEHSRTRIKDWISAGEVLVNGRQWRPKDRVVGGERIEIAAVLPDVVAVAPESIALELVHQDDEVLVVNKPAGLVVHPGAGNQTGTLQNALLHFDPKLASVPRAGIVHRLDKDTSGLLVVARTVEAHTALVEALQERDIEREYEGVCVGVMTSGGKVEAPIDRHPVDRLRMAVREDGREAVTHYRVVQRFRRHTHLSMKLETGRTHQIRVHLTHIGYPLVGDRVYGGRLLLPKGAEAEVTAALRGFKRQALHAARLAFAHPRTEKLIECKAALPEDIQSLLRALRADAAGHAADRR